MPENSWALALQIGLTGFGMVFVILTTLYLSLWLIGRLGARFSIRQAKAGDRDKKLATQVEPKRAAVSGG
ncbi:MAG: OadG family protein [Chloroflexota bacterium]